MNVHEQVLEAVRKFRSPVTQEELKRNFWYDPVVGVFVRINTDRSPGKIMTADRHYKGYVPLYLNGRKLRAHQMEWLYMYGEMPPMDIDHIDRNKQNNAISNLRLCTAAENAHNRIFKKRVSASSGHENITRVGNRFYVRVTTGKGVLESLGAYSSIEEALDVRDAAVKKYRAGFYPL